MGFDGQIVPALCAQVRQIILAIGQTQHPFCQPLLKAFDAARLGVILAEGGVVAVVMALHRRGVRAARLVDEATTKALASL